MNQLGIPTEKLLKDETGYVALQPVSLKECSKLGIYVKSVACGEAHTLVLDSYGKVYSFGWAEDGQLGLNDECLQDSVMSKNMSLVRSMTFKVVKIAAGCLFSACLTEEGLVFVWGNGEQGQLGLGNSINSCFLPTLVSCLNEAIEDIVCGDNHVVCFARSGTVYAWGRGVIGESENQNFSKGSDIICFVPQVIYSLDVIQHYSIQIKPSQESLASLLTQKLLRLQGN